MGGNSSKVTEWVKKVSGKPGSVKANKLEAAVESFQDFFNNTMSNADKANLSEVIHALGLPIKIAGVMKDPDIVRTLAIAAVLAE